MYVIEQLCELCEFGGKLWIIGLDDVSIECMVVLDLMLGQVVIEVLVCYCELCVDLVDFLKFDEVE